YTDRAGWAFHTPKAGGPIDRTHLTQIGRALERLGVEHIGAYSPQARGRGERLNRTVQGRLVNELALAGITTLAAANAYLTERFLADYNDEFARPPADSTSAFVPLPGVDLDAILCEQEDRRVGQDNVVTLDTIALQIAKQPGRPSCAGVRVTVRRDVHGMISVWHGARCFGRYDGQGRPLALDQPKNARAHLPQDRRSITISSPGIPRLRRTPSADAAHDCPPASVTERTDHLSKPSGHFTCQQHRYGHRPRVAERRYDRGMLPRTSRHDDHHVVGCLRDVDPRIGRLVPEARRADDGEALDV